MPGGGITAPTRPSGEIMSVDEVEPIEAEAADENAVAPRGTHLASTQTVTHEYLTQSGKVMRETVKTDGTVTLVLDFIYDESGKPFAMIDQLGASPKTYYYVLNLQGDVVKLVTESGAVAASYEYDAWGKILSSSGSKAEINPLRYRGYYYDTETGFYYLQSRYYDPVTHRFINADAPEYSEIAADSLDDTNLFAYCSNNPVMRVDETGELCSWLKKTIAAVAIVAAVAVVAVVTVATAGSCTAVAAIAVGAAKGAAIGMVVGGATGAAQGAISHRRKTGSWKGAGQAALEGMGDGALTGAITGAIQGGMSGYSGYLKNGACFVAGTTVATATGLVAIEKIKAGDLVWAWDEETGDVALKPVVETYINETTELTHIFVSGEEIVATPTHPFYCPVKGWTDAAHLRAGDILILVNGEYVVVEQIQHELLESPIKVYNFQVADYHTYYVSDNGVLVHNKCGGETAAARRGRQMHKEWDYGSGVIKEKVIGKGARVDGIDYVNRIVYELKPNNPRAVRRGLAQLDRYLNILGAEDWAGVLVLYD